MPISLAPENVAMKVAKVTADARLVDICRSWESARAV